MKDKFISILMSHTNLNYIEAEGVVEEQIQEITHFIDANRKSVKDLWPDVKSEPTREFAEFVMMKDSYNRALNDLIAKFGGTI